MKIPYSEIDHFLYSINVATSSKFTRAYKDKSYYCMRILRQLTPEQEKSIKLSIAGAIILKGRSEYAPEQSRTYLAFPKPYYKVMVKENAEIARLAQAVNKAITAKQQLEFNF